MLAVETVGKERAAASAMKKGGGRDAIREHRCVETMGATTVAAKESEESREKPAV